MSVKSSVIKMLIDLCVQILLLFKDNIKDNNKELEA